MIKGTYNQRVYARLVERKVIRIYGMEELVVSELNRRLLLGQSYRRIAKAITLKIQECTL
jgi:hypothetical protein